MKGFLSPIRFWNKNIRYLPKVFSAGIAEKMDPLQLCPLLFGSRELSWKFVIFRGKTLSRGFRELGLNVWFLTRNLNTVSHEIKPVLGVFCVNSKSHLRQILESCRFADLGRHVISCQILKIFDSRHLTSLSTGFESKRPHYRRNPPLQESIS